MMASKDTISQFPLHNPRAAQAQPSATVSIGKSVLNSGEVALIGAGPGDFELLTIKALRFLQQADVVLYDYLVSDEIMALVPSDTILVCVGKRAGHHMFPKTKPISYWWTLLKEDIVLYVLKVVIHLSLVVVAKSWKFWQMQAFHFMLCLVLRPLLVQPPMQVYH